MEVRKLLIILAVVLSVLFLVGCKGYTKPIEKITQKQPNYKNCFAYQQYSGSYDPNRTKIVLGEILVDFNKSLSKGEVNTILNNYNFSYEQSPIREYSFVIHVPKNRELFWACQFEANHFVTFVTLNYIGSTQQNE